MLSQLLNLPGTALPGVEVKLITVGGTATVKKKYSQLFFNVNPVLL